MIPTKLSNVDNAKQTHDNENTVLFTIINSYMKKTI